MPVATFVQNNIASWTFRNTFKVKYPVHSIKSVFNFIQNQ